MKIPRSLRDFIESAESLVYIEDLSGKRGLLQAVNPLAKLIVVVFMIVASLFLSSLSYLSLICVVPLILVLASKIPLKYFVSRTVFIPAFAAIISLPVLFLTYGQPIFIADMGALNLTVTSEGLQRFLLFTIRVWFCVASLSLLILSTGFDKMLKLLSSLKVPPVIVQMFSLTYRYFFVSVHEAQSVLIAKEARTYINKRTINFQVLKDLGTILAALFIRTYERSERVYMAMQSRGFEIESNSKSSLPQFHFYDILFAATAITAFGLLVLL
ncbi:MAG TPA: cobalt ECF transporter T component CbiQ [Acidobacteriota bacterium]|nr:cobalt ECF transporter T component CbiQ [Acidobacteriota bacterium]